MENILESQKSLYQEALNVTNTLGIVSLLAKFGEVKIVGSVAYQLIVKKDIDIHLLTDHNLLDTAYFVYDSLRAINNKFEINIEDHRDQKSSMFIGIQSYSGPKHNWVIDIWITNKREYTGFDNISYFENEMTDSQRLIILSFKEYYNSLNMLNNGFSTIIYDAVLNYNVKSLLEFTEYLKTKCPE